MNKESPLYNSRLLAVYVKLLRDKYPDVSISTVLAYCGIEPYEINDEGCWFTQTQVDRFYTKVVTLTGNKNIAREAGRLAVSPGTIGALRQHTFGLLGPSLAFKVINRLSRNLTRSGEYHSRSFRNNKVEITVTPHAGVEEKPFQCENRIGFFEAIVDGFRLGLPNVDHPECVFEGGSCCRYVVTWKRSISSISSLIRNAYLVLLLLSIFPGFLILPLTTFLYSFGSILFMTLGVSLVTEIIHRQQMYRSMENLWDSSERLNVLIDTSSRNTQLLQEIGQALVHKNSVEDVLTTVAQIMAAGLDFDSGTILLANEEKTCLEIRGAFGYSDEILAHLMSTAFNLENSGSQGPFVLSFHEQKTFIVDNTKDIESSLSEKSRLLIARLGVHSFLCCPIVVEGESLGVIAVTNQTSKRPLVRNDVNILEGIAPTIGVALQNASLVEALQDSFEKTLKVLADSIDTRDYLTAGHSEVVTKYAAGIATELGLAEDDIQMIRIASLLHDYGKIGVPDSILKKNGCLTVEERDIINTHPVRTRQILSQVPFRGLHKQIPHIAGSHHERWDGDGYPQGLAGEAIPLGARIIAVADFFEAITAKRHYRDPMPMNKALALLVESSGSHFDPAIVDAFLAYFKGRNYSLETSASPVGAFEANGVRRKVPRVEYRTQVSIRHGKQILSADTLDIGVKGIYILSSDLVAKGDPLTVTFAPPGSDECIQVRGVVGWVNNRESLFSTNHPEGFAVNFEEIPQHALTLMNTYIRQQMSSVVSHGEGTVLSYAKKL